MKETLAKKGIEYFAVIYEVSKHEPAQGHGYPAYSYTENKYEEFSSKEELEKWIRKNSEDTYSKKTFQVVKCHPMRVETEIKLKYIEDFGDGQR